ncbi:MAG: hypothetical protein GX216_10425 [Methanomicrobiales archaeon]|nr:hypothetical protein [Methanomicrobiales archaeon]
MPRVRINEDDLHSGAGVEGRRKKKRGVEDPPVREERSEKRSPRRSRPIFGDAESDIFYTGRE